MNRFNKFLFVVFGALIFTGCGDILEQKPQDDLVLEEAFETPEELQKLLISCYDVCANTFNGRSQSFAALLGDNLAQPLNNEDLTEIYNRNTIIFNGTIGDYYPDPYFTIYRANFLLEIADGVAGLSADERLRMESEALFLRGLCHWDLVKHFAQPFGATADNSHLGIAIRVDITQDPKPRSTVAQVYAQIISDLQFASENLPETNGNYANRWAAKALLAKVYFQMADYANASALANDVINNGPFALGPLNRFSPDGTTESIFTIVSAANDNRSGGFTGNFRTDVGGVPQLSVTADYYALATADSGDARAAFYEIGNEGQPNQYYGCNKFNNDFFQIPVIHLTDIKLLRAEALILEGSDIPTAVQDINDIRDRAFGIGNNNLTGTESTTELLEAVRLERRLEMVGEGDWVHHLKRRGAQGENIMVRDVPWDCNGMILQFPGVEETSNFIINPSGGC